MRNTSAEYWSPQNTWPRNGAKLPAVSQTKPAGDRPSRSYGIHTAGSRKFGIVRAHSSMRMPSLILPGNTTRLAGSLQDSMPHGWPWKSPTASGANLPVAHHSPWLSVKKTSPSGDAAMPAGERSPAHTGSKPPVGGTRIAQPRQSARPNGSSPNGLFNAIQNVPSPARAGPNAYS